MKAVLKSYPKTGDIAFSYPVELGFYSRAVRFFTKSLWSHCFVLADDYYGESAVLESDLKTQLVPFNKEYIEKEEDAYEIYSPVKASPEARSVAAEYTYFSTAGQTYGFLQIPWFAVRSILHKLFKRTLLENWFPAGVICSELLIVYLKALGGEYAEAFGHLKDNETSPEDIYKIVIQRKDLFSFIGERKI